MVETLLFTVLLPNIIKKKRKGVIKMCNHNECPYRKHCKFSPDYDPEYESDWENKFGWVLPENVNEMEECYSFLDV